MHILKTHHWACAHVPRWWQRAAHADGSLHCPPLHALHNLILSNQDMVQGALAMQGPGASTYSPLQDAVDIQAHRQIVQELQSMGFPWDRAARAALATSNAGKTALLSACCCASSQNQKAKQTCRATSSCEAGCG